MEPATFSKKLVQKKVLIPVILGVGILLLSAALIASPIGNSLAQQLGTNENISSDMPKYDTMSKINGSVSVRDGIKNFFAESVKTPFIAAAQTAQDQIANGTVLGGHLGVTQGYLTYTYFVADPMNDASYKVIIDAGNGQVLYTSERKQLGPFDESMFGPFGHEQYRGHERLGGFGPFWHGFGPFGGFWHNR
jgi:uncharacterized membrane protein YkoI